MKTKKWFEKFCFRKIQTNFNFVVDSVTILVYQYNYKYISKIGYYKELNTSSWIGDLTDNESIFSTEILLSSVNVDWTNGSGIVNGWRWENAFLWNKNIFS
jgi:hypothetical protein